MIMLPSAHAAPGADQFPVYPASWYLFSESREIDSKPLTRRVLGRDLVAFRTRSGRVAILDARCSHLGADLGRGRVVGESIQCPFHHWRYGVDGLCAGKPGEAAVPSFARQACYPARERHGFLFFFNGREELFPLPFFDSADPGDLVPGRVFRYDADCTWYVNAAHGFDTQHFAAVHDRKLFAPPRIDCPAPYARRNRYRAAVVGRTLLDRLLRRFAGDTVEISITTWGGTFVVIEGAFARVRSRFLIVTQPRHDGTTVCEGIVFGPRRANPLVRSLWGNLSLWVRRTFTYGYLLDETRRLRGTLYRPQSLVEDDRDMADFYRWAASLPQGEAERPAPASQPAMLHTAGATAGATADFASLT
jgi:nitrite reductase/ring-hydroxylating ferredoxin subunit